MLKTLQLITIVLFFSIISSFSPEIREKEKSALGHSSVLQSLNLSMTNVVSTFATVTTFIVHIYSGNDLLASQVSRKSFLWAL